MGPKKTVNTNTDETETQKVSNKKYMNTGFLVIVESPSKCAKIEHFLGIKYKCIASKGHLRYIDGLENIDIKGGTYNIVYTRIKEKQKHIESMEKTIKSYDPNNIYIASDDDREGEAIAWHICDIFGLNLSTTKRIVFHEITKQAVINAIQTPRLVDMGLVKSQNARQILDIVIGYKVSPVLWSYISRSRKNPLSAGRCQTPALRLIYDNQKLIDNATHEVIYKTHCHFFSKNIIFNLDKDFVSQTDIIEFLERSKTFDHMLTIDEPKMTTKSSPKPFNTAKLLQSASSQLRISPKQTMDYCQQLYQDGFITYMRTDSQKFSEEFLIKANNYVKQTFGEEYIGDNSRVLNSNSADPHEAIRVTSLENRTINCEEKKMALLYNMIWKNTVESCMKDAVYKTTNANMSAPFMRKYTHTIEIPVFYGWKKVSNDGSTEEINSENGLLFYLSSIDKTKAYKPNSVYCITNITHKHLHYTEASLIQKLEEVGIGRPSTFSNIVESNIEKGYVEKKDVPPIVINCDEYSLMDGLIRKDTKTKEFCQEKGKLVITPIGVMCVEFLTQNFEKIFSYDYTSIMETLLDKIADGTEETWYSICNNCYNEIKDYSRKIKKLEKQNYILKDTEEYIVVIENNCVLLRKTVGVENGKPLYEYKSTKPELAIDFEKLKAGEYTFHELNDIDNPLLGKYDGHEVFIKHGQYGYYIEWGTKRASIKSLQADINKLTMKDVLPLIYEKEGIVVENSEDINSFRAPVNSRKVNGVLRELNEDFNIRSGKFGPYVYYKPKAADKAQFFSLKAFRKGFLTCSAEELIDWVCEKYNLPRLKAR